MKQYCLNSILVGTALVLASAGISQAGPSPDLMNSIQWLRFEAQKNSKAGIATAKSIREAAAIGNWSHTRTITAGQSSVAAPDTSHRAVANGTAGEFKLAPLQQPGSRPENK